MNSRYGLVPLFMFLLLAATVQGQILVRQLAMEGSSTTSYFLNENIGYVTGSLGTCKGVTHTRLYRTTDGGLSWNDLYECDTTRMRRSDFLQFLDSTHGFSMRWFSDTRQNVLRRTTNGGRSWIDVDSTRADIVHFFNAQDGIRAYKVLEGTTNGGATWTFVDSAVTDNWGYQFIQGSDVGYAQVLSAPPPTRTTLYELGRTTDRGATWKRLPLPKYPTQQGKSSSWFFGVNFSGVAVGYGWTNGNADTFGLFRTADSGRSWRRVASFDAVIGAKVPTTSILDVKFVDDTTGYVAGINTNFGENNTSGNGFIVRTTDGGNNWQALRFSGKRNIPFTTRLSIYPTSRSAAYFVTNKLEVYKHECTLDEPAITITGASKFPEGDSARLSSRSGVAYTWSTGDTTQEITVRHSGRYAVHVVLAGGCAIYDSVDITVDAAVKQGPIVTRNCFYTCGPVAVNEVADRAILTGACDGEVNVRFVRAKGLSNYGEMIENEWEDPDVEAVAIDNFGNTYMLLRYDSFLAKLIKIRSTSIEWTRDFEHVPLDPAFLIQIDGQGRAVVTLSEWVQGHQAHDVTVTRFTQDGTIDLRNTYQYRPGTSIVPGGLRLGSDGSISVTANMNGNLIAIDYAADGTQQTPRVYSRHTMSREVSRGLARGINNEILVTGLSYGPGDTAVVVASLSGSGATRWEWAAGLHDDIVDIQFDATPDGGAILVMMRDQYSADSLVPAVIRFDRDGKVLWSRRVTDDTSDYHAIRQIGRITASFVDRFGNTYIAGPSREPYPDEKFRIMRLDGNGHKRWEYLNQKGGKPLQIIGGAGNALYVGTQYEGTTNQCSLLRFEQLGTVSSVAEAAVPAALRSSLRAWPNPAQDEITIEYRLASAGNVKLDLFDVTGALVQQVDHGYRTEGTHTVVVEISGLPAGNYHTVLITDEFSETQPVTVRHR